MSTEKKELHEAGVLFIRRVANVPLDGECSTCGCEGDKPNPKCDSHEEYDMSNDDVVETLSHLVYHARHLLGENDNGESSILR
jgi:hypothetical protein